MQFKILLSLFLILFSLFFEAKLGVSEELIPFEYDSDLTNLLLVDRDANLRLGRVMRRKGLHQFIYKESHSQSKKTSDFEQNQLKRLKDRVADVTDQINQIFDGQFQIFTHKSQTSSRKREAMAVFYGMGTIEEIYRHHIAFFKKQSPNARIYEYTKNKIFRMARKNPYCLQLYISEETALLGGIFIVSLREENEKYLDCMEEKIIESVGLFGNQKLLKDYTKGSFERQVLRDLYLTDKYIGLSLPKINKIAEGNKGK